MLETLISSFLHYILKRSCYHLSYACTHTHTHTPLYSEAPRKIFELCPVPSSPQARHQEKIENEKEVIQSSNARSLGFSFSISTLGSREGTANLPLQVFSSSYQLSRKGDSGTIVKEKGVTPASKSTWKCSLASACGPRRCDSAAPQWSPRSGQVLSEDKVEALSVPVSPRVPGLSSPQVFCLGLQETGFLHSGEEKALGRR